MHTKSQTIIMSATSYCPNTGATNRGVLQHMCSAGDVCAGWKIIVL